MSDVDEVYNIVSRLIVTKNKVKLLTEAKPTFTTMANLLGQSTILVNQIEEFLAAAGWNRKEQSAAETCGKSNPCAFDDWQEETNTDN